MASRSSACLAIGGGSRRTHVLTGVSVGPLSKNKSPSDRSGSEITSRGYASLATPLFSSHSSSGSVQGAAWLPRLSRAPSHAARGDALTVMASPPRLSDTSSNSRSGDAEGSIGPERGITRLAAQRRAQAFASLAVLLTVMPVPAVGREHRQRAGLAVVLGVVRTSGARDATDRRSPYGVGTLRLSCTAICLKSRACVCVQFYV